MEHSNVCLIIAHIWMVGAWLVDGIVGFMMMVIVSLIWMFLSVYAQKQETKFARMKLGIINKAIDELQEKTKKPEKKKK